MHRLLESDLDLETQTVKQDDLLCFQCEVGCQEDDPPSRGMIDEDETELAVRVLHTAYGLDAADEPAV